MDCHALLTNRPTLYKILKEASQKESNSSGNIEYTKEEHQKDASIYGQILVYDFFHMIWIYLQDNNFLNNICVRKLYKNCSIKSLGEKSILYYFSVIKLYTK